MKHIIITALSLCICLVLTSCINNLPQETDAQTSADNVGTQAVTADKTGTPALTDEAGTQAVTDTGSQTVTDKNETSAVTDKNETSAVTDKPVTQPVTDKPVTQPVTEKPVTNPVTEKPVTQPVTDKPEEPATTEAVAGPDIFNCSYFNTVTRYAYNTLDAKGRELYGKMLQAALKMKPSVAAGSDKDAAIYAYNCLYYDSPELFYLSDKADYSNGVITFDYIFSPNEAFEMQNGMESAYNSFYSANINNSMDEYDKMLAVYEYLIKKTDYAHTAYTFYELGIFNNAVNRSMSAAGPLIDGKAICTGYARATQYMALRLGIQALLVTGHASGGNHAFTIVKLNNEYYYVDTTWGDPYGDDPYRVSYTYFCITTNEITQTHEIDCPITIPVCTATGCNYYVHEGLFVNDGDISGIFLSAAKLYSSGGSEYTVKYEDSNLGLRAYDIINASDFELSEAYKAALSAYPTVKDVDFYAVWTARFKLLTIRFK